MLTLLLYSRQGLWRILQVFSLDLMISLIWKWSCKSEQLCQDLKQNIFHLSTSEEEYIPFVNIWSRMYYICQRRKQNIMHLEYIALTTSLKARNRECCTHNCTRFWGKVDFKLFEDDSATFLESKHHLTSANPLQYRMLILAEAVYEDVIRHVNLFFSTHDIVLYTSCIGYNTSLRLIIKSEHKTILS